VWTKATPENLGEFAAKGGMAIETSASVMSAFNTLGEKPEVIIIMGATGSGKSYFINRLAGQTVVEEGGSLNSCRPGGVLA
jgi:predicted GTPase